MVMLLIIYFWALQSTMKKWPRFWWKGSKKQREDGVWAEVAQGAAPLNLSVFHKGIQSCFQKTAALLPTEVSFAFKSQVSFLTDLHCLRVEFDPGSVHCGGSRRASHMSPCNNMLWRRGNIAIALPKAPGGTKLAKTLWGKYTGFCHTYKFVRILKRRLVNKRERDDLTLEMFLVSGLLRQWVPLFYGV